MKEYLVKWEINAHGKTPKQAALKALKIMLKLHNPENEATVFEINGKEYDLFGATVIH
jgi:hypothetical protein